MSEGQWKKSTAELKQQKKKSGYKVCPLLEQD